MCNIRIHGYSSQTIRTRIVVFFLLVLKVENLSSAVTTEVTFIAELGPLFINCFVFCFFVFKGGNCDHFWCVAWSESENQQQMFLKSGDG